MRDLLFLAHRLPFPPNKGDKITTYNLLRFLSGRYRVHLGCFVDQPEDWEHLPIVRSYCSDSYFARLSPRRARLASLRGLFSGSALTLTYYDNRELRAWVEEKLESVKPASILVFSGAMAQFLGDELAPDTNTVLDLEDVDSEKWRQYGERKPWPVNLIYRREARLLLDFERRMAERLDVSVFVSREEAGLFASLAPELRDKIVFRTQGVDSDFFDPALEYENPYGHDAPPALVFVGAMDYWPNVEAVVWFADNVLPLARRQLPDLRFYIVGLNPTDEVTRLSSRPGIEVTGSVDDVRPYVAHAMAVVVPLQIARGIQNKVLEALAMAKPVIATRAAMTGIETVPGVRVAVSDDAAEMATQIMALAQDPPDNPQGRETVLAHYNWERNLEVISGLLEGRWPQGSRLGADR